MDQVDTNAAKLSANDPPPLPGEATSWAPGEPAPSPMGTNIDDLVRPPKGLQEGLVDISKRKGAADEQIYQRMANTTDEDQKRLRDAYDKTGIQPGEFKKWNADEEMAKRRTDPIEAFGSFGSVFGILASAFTHAPMENAMNASAAAMNAIKAGDEAGYDKAYKAWQDNTKVALERHQMEHQAFTDASVLMKTNLEAGLNMARLNAARFDNKKEQYLLENGMIKEWFDYQAAKQKAGLALAETMPKIEDVNHRRMDLKARGYDEKHPDSDMSIQAYRDWSKYWQEVDHPRVGAFNPTKMALDRFIAENPNASSDDVSEYIRNLKGPSSDVMDLNRGKVDVQKQRNDEIAWHNARLEEIQNGRGDVSKLRQEETARHNKAMEAVATKKTETGGASRDLTIDRQNASAVAEQKKAWRAEGIPEDEVARRGAQLYKDLKTRSSAPSGNKIDELTGKIDRVTYMESTIDKVEGLLAKHKAIAGLGGAVTRPAEAISNIFGSDETDRRQFERWIAELQEWAPSALNDRNGRPLSSEASKIQTIIAGLRIGDTTANTVRAYRELKPLLAKIKSNLGERRGSKAPDAEKTSGGDKSSPWLRDPVAQ